MDSQIISGGGQVVIESNSKARFGSGLDGKGDFFVFSKYHKLYNKYSINLFELGKEKKILYLMDDYVNKLHLFGDADKAILF